MALLLSPRDLAAALGVSESSLKRWIDAGRIRATRTEGGHRRITLADARAFVRETGAPVLRPEILGLDQPANAAQDNEPGEPDDPGIDEASFQRALFSGNAKLVRRWLRRRLELGTTVAELCDGPIRSAMHTVGELWQHDPDGVFVEHRATDLCIQALATLRTELEPRDDAPVAIGGVPEDDPYLLPSAMAALVLAGEGYRAINLGADTPTPAFLRAVTHHRPRVLWISASAPLPPSQAHEIGAFLANLPPGVTALVGGRQHAPILEAVHALATKPSTAVRACASMGELASIARSLR